MLNAIKNTWLYQYLKYTFIGDYVRNIKMRHIRNAFKNTYPTVKCIYPHNAKKFKKYSQAGQDGIIYNTFFKNVTDGVYCDIGGNHPININNTYMFEKLGWQGVVFEPLPHMKPLWEKHRNAKFFPYAISNENKKIPFSIVKNTTGWEDALSYIPDTLNHNLGTEDYEISTINIQAVRLSDILESQHITHIDYMSLDVEGHEMQALQGINFDTLHISVLSIENNSNMNNMDPHMGDHKIRTFMESKGYIFYMRILGLDDIYVHKDFVY